MTDQNYKNRNSRIPFLVEAALMLFWLSFLRNTDGYYSPYLLMGGLGIVCGILNRRNRTLRDEEPFPEIENRWYKRQRFIEIFLSVLFALACCAANYSLFTEQDLSYYAGKTARIFIALVSLALCLTGGYLAAANILRFLRPRGRSIVTDFIFNHREENTKPVFIFLFSAGLIALFDCFILFFVKYPGVLTEDSISQIEQLMSGVYSNHHPFYHTLLIRLCINAGLKVFGDFNAAVAVYSVFQIILVSCTFGYVLSTMCRMKMKKELLLLTLLWFTLLPCHFMYSFSMWKDVPFALTMTVFLVTFFRIRTGISKRSAKTMIFLTVSAVGVCLLRSNGWAVFFASFLIFLILFGKKEKKLCILFVVVLLVSWVLKNPVLNALGVSKTDTIESLSIPGQQIARVIDECREDLTEEQRALLQKIVDVESVPVYYCEFISNPVKNLVRATGDQTYLKEHALDYFKLYVQLGLSHPKQYFEAYVEQTKGLWNGGYNYWITADMISENSFGITRETLSGTVNSLVEQYIYLFSSNEFLALFQSIGLHVWMTVVFLYASLAGKNRTALFITVPLLMNVLSLLAATPVFSEFRYTYSIFTVFPFLAVSAFYQKKEVPACG